MKNLLGNTTNDDLCLKLRNEINDNKQYYQKFSGINTDIMAGINKYINEKQYNTDSAEMILSALRNALSITATIYQYRNEALVEIQQIPCKPGVTTTGCIHLSLNGQGAGAHYNAVSKHRESGASISVTSPSFQSLRMFQIRRYHRHLHQSLSGLYQKHQRDSKVPEGGKSTRALFQQTLLKRQHLRKNSETVNQKHRWDKNVKPN